MGRRFSLPKGEAISTPLPVLPALADVTHWLMSHELRQQAPSP